MQIKFLSVLLVCSMSLFSQNNIKGIVVDENKNPIEQVFVHIETLGQTVYTNSEGVFTIKGIDKGTHSLIFSKSGFKTQSISLKTPLSDPKLMITLVPSIIEMDEIIISTPFHKLQRDNIVKVDKMSTQTHLEQGVLTLSEGISELEGVTQITTGLGIGKPVIRGLSSNRVLVYNQGVRLENQQFGDEHGLGVNGSGIESVELIKGPASLLYGSDAMGGVLYLNHERFAVDNAFEGDLQTRYFSNTQGQSSSLSAKWSGTMLKFLARGSTTSHADYKTKSYRVTNTRFQEEDYKFGVGFQNKQLESELRFNYNTSLLGIPHEIGNQSLSKSVQEPYQSVTSQFLSLSSKVHFEQSRLEVTLGLSENERKEFEDAHDEHDDHDEHDEHDDDDDHDEHKAALHMKLQTASCDIKYYFPKWNKFELIAGVQGQQKKNTNFGEETLVPDAQTKDFGVFLVSDAHFGFTDLQLGIRAGYRNIEIKDVATKNFSSYNLSFGVKRSILEHAILRFNLASGFRAPNLAELTSNGVHHGTNRFEIGDVNLKEEQNIQSDLSFEYINDHIEIDLGGFYNHINNYIYLSPTGNNRNNIPEFEYLQSDARLYGGEVSLHVHPHPLDWLHLKSSFETVVGKGNNNTYLPLIPANTIKQLLQFDIENSFLEEAYGYAKIQHTFAQNKLSAFETKSNPYTLLHMGFGSTFRLFKQPLKVTVSVNNLTDKSYVDHLSRLKNEGIYNTGRNIVFGLNYRF